MDADQGLSCALEVVDPFPLKCERPIDISLLLPTRGRPKLAERFIKSVCDTAVDLSKIEIVLYLDQDDYSSHAIANNSVRVVKIIGPRSSMGYYNSRCLAASRGKLLVLANDDIIIRTWGWDRVFTGLLFVFPDELFLAYPNDLLKGERIATFPVISRRCADVLIEPYPRAYAGAFIDVHLLDVFRRLKLRGQNRIVFLSSVVFEHMHHTVNKGLLDVTYLGRDRFADDDVYLQLANWRRAASEVINCRILGLPSEDGLESPEVEKSRLGWIDFIRAAFSLLLSDRKVPFPWRVKEVAWLFARRMASVVI